MILKDKIIPSFLLIPFLSHWILPDGLESKFYIDFIGIPIYLIDLCYLIYICNYGSLYCPKAYYSNLNIKFFVKLFAFSFVFYEIFLSFLTSNNDVVLKILGNNMFVFSALIFLHYPLSEKTIDKTKYVVIMTAVVVALEVILFSLGILHYDADLGNQEYGGIVRISSTVGAATGTAVALVILGTLIVSVYELKEITRWSLCLLITVSIFFTISRGSICVWSIYLFFIIYRRYIQHSTLNKRIACLILCIITIFSLFKVDVFDPVLERQDNLSSTGNVATGRDDLQNEALYLYSISGGLGVGHGETNLDKSIKSLVVRSHPLGVHSLYYMILAELGIPGIFMLISFLLFIISKFDYRKLISYYSLLLIGLSFSSEPIFVFAEFAAPSFFVFSISLKKKLETNDCIIV